METVIGIIEGVLLILVAVGGWGCCFLVGRREWKAKDKRQFGLTLLIAFPLFVGGVFILLQAAQIFLTVSSVSYMAGFLDSITLYVVFVASVLFVAFEAILYHRLKDSFSPS